MNSWFEIIELNRKSFPLRFIDGKLYCRRRICSSAFCDILRALFREDSIINWTSNNEADSERAIKLGHPFGKQTEKMNNAQII